LAECLLHVRVVVRCRYRRFRDKVLCTPSGKGKDHKWQSARIRIRLDSNTPSTTSRSGEQVIDGGRGHGWLPGLNDRHRACQGKGSFSNAGRDWRSRSVGVLLVRRGAWQEKVGTSGLRAALGAFPVRCMRVALVCCGLDRRQGPLVRYLNRASGRSCRRERFARQGDTVEHEKTTLAYSAFQDVRATVVDARVNPGPILHHLERPLYT
jgi:hypothetical protein